MTNAPLKPAKATPRIPVDGRRKKFNIKHNIIVGVSMPRTKMTISLIKEGIDAKNILKKGMLHITLPNGNKLYYKKNEEKIPDWLDSFFGQDIPKNRNLLSKTVSAVIFYDIEVEVGVQRKFAITFGNGRMLLNSNVIEERFGLMTALNTVNAAMLRSIDTSSLDTNSLDSRIQSGNLTGVDTFNIDKGKDMLKSISGKADKNWYNSTMTGAAGLTIIIEKTYKDISPFLVNCYKSYKSVEYQKQFQWVDKMRQVTDAKLIDGLNDKLLEALNSDHFSNLYFSVPEIIDWKEADRFQIKNSELYDDVDIDKLKAVFPNGFKRTTIRVNHLSLIDDVGHRKQAWPIYKCLSVDLEYDGQRYLLNDGVWYELFNGFVDEINAFYKGTPIAKYIQLSDYGINSEEKFNKTAEKEHKLDLCLIDRKLVTIDGDSVEPCDLYSKNGQFIHVKHYTGSSVLSHLFNQGLVSAESMFDNSFRRKVREELREGFNLADDNEYNASDYEVVFVIAKTKANRKELPDIPFFSKVAFRNVSRRLKMYGYKVSILGIPYTYVDRKKDAEKMGN